MSKTLFVKFLLISCLLIIFAVHANFNFLTAQDVLPPEQWYCDARWNTNGSIYIGTVREISPYERLKIDERAQLTKLAAFAKEHNAENVVRFEIEKNYKGDDEARELEFYNVRTINLPAINFKVGERYLLYTDSFAFNEGGKNYSRLAYIRPDGQTKLYSESAPTVAFLEKIYKLDFLEEVLGDEAKNAISGGVIGGKAARLVKPPYPQEAKKEKASGTINVHILTNENGIVIKAKALCPSHPGLGKAAEAAALQSSFSPTTISGKPVKIRGVIVYNFVPQ